MRIHRRFPIVLVALLASCGSSSGTDPDDPPPPVLQDPPPSAGHALVYHSGLAVVVLVNAGLGGPTSPPSTSRTILWQWNGHAWSILDSGGPPIRNLGGVAYDSHRDRIVMHGGSYDANLIYDDTWEWSSTSGWQRTASGAGPGKRDHTDMVYDAERRRTVMFGGSPTPGAYATGTWLWDGTSWQASPASGPSDRIHHAMVYDPSTKRTILFGGRSDAGALGDTWAWTGMAWEPVASPGTPRSHARLGATSNGVILFGGVDPQATIVQFVAGVWSPLAGAGPSARYLSAMAYDAHRQVTVLFGGGDAATDQILSDTWEYSATSGWRRVP